MMTSSIAAGAMPERRTASFITIAPSWGAVKLARLPRNLPVGVLAAPTITGIRSVIVGSSCLARCLRTVLANETGSEIERVDLPRHGYLSPGQGHRKGSPLLYTGLVSRLS